MSPQLRRAVVGIRFRPKFTEHAQIDNWRRSETLLQLVKRRFSTFAGAKIVEDSFQRGRAEENEGANGNKEMNPRPFFDRILRAEIVGQIHKYKEVAWSGQAIPRGHKDATNNNFFQVPMRSASPALKGVIGKTSTTKWYSPSPLHACHQDADLELARHLRATGMWDFAQRSWLCVLLRGHRVMIRTTVGDGPLRSWMLVVGDLQGAVVLCLLVVEVVLGQQILYAPDHRATHEQVELAFILKLEDWEGALRMVVAASRPPVGRGRAGLVVELSAVLIGAEGCGQAFVADLGPPGLRQGVPVGVEESRRGDRGSVVGG